MSADYSASQELADLRSQFNFVERAQTDNASRKETQRDNTGRNATAEMTYISTGIGQHRISKPLRFPITFRSEPHLSTGCATVANPTPKVLHDPIGTGGIYQWLRDGDGNFIGAKIWVRVEVHPVGSDTETATALAARKVKTCHYFSFSGFAIKDLPTSAIDPQLEPRTVQLLSAKPPVQGIG